MLTNYIDIVLYVYKILTRGLCAESRCIHTEDESAFALDRLWWRRERVSRVNRRKMGRDLASWKSDMQHEEDNILYTSPRAGIYYRGTCAAVRVADDDCERLQYDDEPLLSLLLIRLRIYIYIAMAAVETRGTRAL